MNPQEKNIHVRKQITKALISLMGRKKINDISISELCDKAQVGRASFYRNYDSKEEVIRHHTEALINGWADEIDRDPSASISSFFQSLFQHFQKNQSFYKILYRQNMSTTILAAIRSRLNMDKDIGLSSLYARAFTAYGIFGWIDVWFSNGMKETPEELNRIIVENLNKIIIGAKSVDTL